MRLSTALDAYFLAKDLTPAARTWYSSKLTRFAAYCTEQGAPDIEGVTAPLVRTFLAHLRVAPSPRYGRPVTSQTLHGYARAVKAFLRWCAGDDLIPEKVARRVEMPKREQKVIQVFTREHLGRLFAAAALPNEKYPWFPARDVAILSLLLDCGIRAEEMCDLTTDRVHISPDDAYILVNGKGRKQREIGMGRKSRLALHRYLHRHRPHVPGLAHVFLTRDHKPMHPEGLDRLVYRLRDAAGAGHFTGVRCSAHTFRHTMATAFIDGGGDVYKLSRLLGHTSVVVTEGYLRALSQRQARQGGLSVLDNL